MAPREHLRDTIERLRNELASGESLAASDRQALERTLDEVVGLLDGDALNEEHQNEQHENLVGILRKAALGVEASHPKLTLAIGAVADSLARLGL